MTQSVAFATVSYGPDRDRCALLSRSLDEFAPSGEHFIVVDRADIPLFRPLESNRTSIVATEEVLPLWLHRLDMRRVGLRSNLWVQARGRPIRGWLVQQLVKFALAEKVRADVLIHADSDVVLMRPFEVSSVVAGDGRVRLYARRNAVDETLSNHVVWHRTAEKLLGIRPARIPMADFITSFVPWKRVNAVELLKHVERNTGRHWLRALAAAWDVSEYTLYGRFATDILGESAGQYVDSSSLCRDYWEHVPLTPSELEAFLDGVGPEEVAVMVSAKAGMDAREYADVLERRWAALQTSDS
jgi:hypothetical protein